MKKQQIYFSLQTISQLVLVVVVEGIKYRVLPDTGAESSYISSNLANDFEKNPVQKECNRIERLLHSVVKKAEITIPKLQFPKNPRH